MIDRLHHRWRITLFLFLAAGLNYADRAALSAVIPPLRDELGASDTQIGISGLAFLWSYAICSPIAGSFADRFSRSRIIALSLGSWSAITLLIGFAAQMEQLIVLRGLLGIAESLYFPAATALLAVHHGPDTRGRAMGLHPKRRPCLRPVAAPHCVGDLVPPLADRQRLLPDDGA